MSEHARADVEMEGNQTGNAQPETTEVEISPAPFEGRFRRFNEKIGRGAQKVIYKAQDTQSGEIVAWNSISLTDLTDEEQHRAVEEAQLLSRLQHPRLINCHASWRSKDQIVLITQLVKAGSLKKYVQTHELSLGGLRGIAKQVLEGLQHLHRQNPPIVHRDIKCENILYNAETNEIVIGDLGLSTQLTTRGCNRGSFTGTPHFMAPELYDEEYDETVDVYSFGLTLLEMATGGQIPYAECTNQAQIYKRIVQNELPEALSHVRIPALAEYIRFCILKQDDNTRPSAIQALNHPFIQTEALEDDSTCDLVERLRQSSVETSEMLPSHASVDTSVVRGRERATSEDSTDVSDEDDVRSGVGTAPRGSERKRCKSREESTKRAQSSRSSRHELVSSSAPLYPIPCSEDPVEVALPGPNQTPGNSLRTCRSNDRSLPASRTSTTRPFSNIHVSTNINVSSGPQSVVGSRTVSKPSLFSRTTETLNAAPETRDLLTGAATAGIAAASMKDNFASDSSVLNLCLLIEYQPGNDEGTKRARVTFDYDTSEPPGKMAEEIVAMLIEARNVMINHSAKHMFEAFLGTLKFGPLVTIHTSGVPEWGWRSITLGPSDSIISAINCRNDPKFCNNDLPNVDVAFNTAAYAATVAAGSSLNRVHTQSMESSVPGLSERDDRDTLSAPVGVGRSSMLSAHTHSSCEDSSDEESQSHTVAATEQLGRVSVDGASSEGEDDEGEEDTTSPVSTQDNSVSMGGTSNRSGKGKNEFASPGSFQRVSPPRRMRNNSTGSPQQDGGRLSTSPKSTPNMGNAIGHSLTVASTFTLDHTSTGISGGFPSEVSSSTATQFCSPLRENIHAPVPQPLAHSNTPASANESSETSKAVSQATSTTSACKASVQSSKLAVTSTAIVSYTNIKAAEHTTYSNLSGNRSFSQPNASTLVVSTESAVTSTPIVSHSNVKAAEQHKAYSSPSGNRSHSQPDVSSVVVSERSPRSTDGSKRRKMDGTVPDGDSHTEPGESSKGRGRFGSNATYDSLETKSASHNKADINTFCYTSDELSLVDDLATPEKKETGRKPLNKVPSLSNLSAASQRASPSSFVSSPTAQACRPPAPSGQQAFRSRDEQVYQGSGLAGLGYASSSPVARPAFRNNAGYAPTRPHIPNIMTNSNNLNGKVTTGAGVNRDSS